MLIGLLFMSPPAATLPWLALTLGFDDLLSPSFVLNLTTAQMPVAMSFRKSQRVENMTPSGHAHNRGELDRLPRADSDCSLGRAQDARAAVSYPAKPFSRGVHNS
jgi:hypothetical protein